MAYDEKLLERIRAALKGRRDITEKYMFGGVAFLLVPLLLTRLGTSAYGTWVLIGSLFAYSSVLHFGFTSAISREVAVALATGTEDDLRRILNTGTVFFAGVGVMIGVASGNFR